MFVTKLTVSGLKRLRDVTLTFGESGQPRQWTVILGENGRCKTSILRAIAMAASGAARTNQLADIPSLIDRREDAPEHGMRLEGWFDLVPSATRPHDAVRSTVRVPRGHSVASGESFFQDGERDVTATASNLHVGHASFDPVSEARSTNSPGWMVLGYGTSRTLTRPFQLEPTKDPARDRVASLFDRAPVVGTGFADQLEGPRSFARVLREALVEGGLVPGLSDLELRGRGGVRSAQDLEEGHRFEIRMGGSDVKLPSTWLSHGQQATIAWIADVIGHFFLEAGRPIEREDMRGLVLVDELDLHLHPKWQVRLVDALRRAFPNLQFVATTHSPMILPALRADELIVLDEDGHGSVTAQPAPSSPQLMTAAEIYASFFDLRATAASSLAREYRRYGFLVGNAARTDDEEREMHAIRAKLADAGADPGWEPVPREEVA